jgi:LruC domain-containing protein
VNTWTAHFDVTLGYEDLPLETGANDFDYNDWTVDVKSAITYSLSGTNSLMKEIQMDFVPQARGGAYQHEFQVRLPARLLASSGKATVTLYDQGHKALSAQTISFVGGQDALLTIFSNTADVFPGSIVNTIEGQPDYPPARTADVKIEFDTPFAFTVNPADLRQPHGTGLFYDPVLVVLNTGEQIHSGDVRLLSVPSTHWLWPEESVRIDRAYPQVIYQPADPLNFLFPDGWWTNFNHCVYDGVVCGTP